MRKFWIILLFISSLAYSQGRYPFAVTPVTIGEDYIDGALLWLRFSGDYTDETGQNDGTNSGTTLQGDTACLYADSDGNDYVNVGDFWTASIDTFTLSYLVYLDEDLNENYWGYGNAIRFVTSQPGMYLNFDNDGASHFEIIARISDDANDQSYAGTASSACDNDIVPDTWHHIIEIYYHVDASTTHWICWVDGLYCHSSGDSIINKPTSWVNSGGDLRWGMDGGTTYDGFREGDLYDEIMIFDGDLRYHPGGNYINTLIANPYQMPLAE